MNIGFIGLGIMGEAMCANIIKKHDGKVFLYDLDCKKVEKLVSLQWQRRACRKERCHNNYGAEIRAFALGL